MVKKIKIYGGKITLVDDEDYDQLNQYKWQLDSSGKGEGYARTNLYTNKKTIVKRMHQFLIDTPKGMQTDHIDRNSLNNQKSNLRIVTRSQNNMNRSKQNGCLHKYKGVKFHKKLDKWEARIKKDKKLYYLGLFKNEIDAAKAYNKKAIEFFGEYACLNEV